MELTPELEARLTDLVQTYTTTIRSADEIAHNTEGRAYGGVLRAIKGRLQEDITEALATIAWQHIGGDPDLLEINSKKIPIRIRDEYIDRITEREIRNHIRENIDDYVYKLSVDKHLFINGNFAIGIECKAYTENAMIKRILIDFYLLKTQYPDLSCYLFQLESQLGGDYSTLEKPVYGSRPTHTIQSYFSCDLRVITLLEGERDIDRPIHRHFKPLNIEVLRDTVEILAEDMRRFL